MARNPKQDANLKPARSKSEARERGQKGGKASGRSRKALKAFKEVAADDLTAEEQQAMIRAVKTYAKRGSLAHFEFFLKLIGEHPDQLKDMQTDSGMTISIDGGGDYGD